MTDVIGGLTSKKCQNHADSNKKMIHHRLSLLLWFLFPLAVSGMTSNNMSNLQCNLGVLEKVPSSLVDHQHHDKKHDPLDVVRLYMDDDGTFPNNPHQPLIVIRSAFSGSPAEGESAIVGSSGGQWTFPWAWGIFPYHHYHSTAWELLVCVQGEADVQWGGPTGPTMVVAKGDVALVPPGLAHKQVNARQGFTLLGSYPTSTTTDDKNPKAVDTLTGVPTANERDNIRNCPLPPTEPILGLDVSQFW